MIMEETTNGSQGNIEKMGNDTHHDNRADQYFDKLLLIPKALC